MSQRNLKTIKDKSVTSSLTQNCLGSLKPSKTKGVCDPSKTFYQHVMQRTKPRYCLMVKKKLNHFKWNIKNAYVKNDKEKYELLKLKTERKWPKAPPLTVTIRTGSRLPKSFKMLITAELSTIAHKWLKRLHLKFKDESFGAIKISQNLFRRKFHRKMTGNHIFWPGNKFLGH